MADWSIEGADGILHTNIAALVTAAALEANAKNQFEFIDLLGLFYDRENGYFYKEGCSDFFHASSGYCYRFNPIANQNEWTYNPSWAADIRCVIDPAVYELLLDLSEFLDVNIKSTHRDPVDFQDDEELADDEDDDLLANFYGLDKSERQLMEAETSVIPCIRIMPEQSESLSPRSLLIVTIAGATVGSDSSCDVCISDQGVSKEHCRIDYDDERSSYTLNPMTKPCYLNGVDLEKDKKVELAHGDQLQIGRCSLRLHIHRGFNTCAECEPGLIELPSEATSFYSHIRGSRESRRRKELKQLKKQFGLNVPEIEKFSSGSYIDRAKIRRKIIGSDNPYEVVSQEYVVSSSGEDPISKESKGFKMLANLGWKAGTGLGKRQEGIKEPIKPKANWSTSGLGSDVLAAPRQKLTKEQQQKRMRWDKARERFMRAGST